ncbi:hypothetical protein GIB67_019814 [Kingdonia uniflora]|uniref:Uncharacterized protein n=1 Tax=Kingdonia uniflora TaxID=39325 RepID=A0A7J7MKL9_9MAGN|nr:hypothetical protein GIB67_019814 [Kingdonia uniflora]
MDKPLQKAIERLNLMIMKLMFKRRTKATTWDQDGLVPRAAAHLEKVMQHYGEYDIEGGNLDEWVSIESSDSSYYSHYQFVSAYNATYSGVVHPVSDSSHWEKVRISQTLLSQAAYRRTMGIETPTNTTRSTYMNNKGGRPLGSRPKPVFASNTQSEVNNNSAQVSGEGGEADIWEEEQEGG